MDADDPAIAPDQSYLIFGSHGLRAPLGQEHLFIAFRTGTSWGPPIQIRYEGDDWPSENGNGDGEPQVSPDGTTLYFDSSRSVPIDLNRSRTQFLADAARLDAWNNGNSNVWALPCGCCSTYSVSARRRSKPMLRNKVLAVVVAVLAAPAMAQTATPQREKVAIVGATLIDVSGYGRSTNDIGNSVVLIDDGKITAAGSASQVPIPSDSPRIDAHGKFLIPGLIDGFGALRAQAFGNAYLYEGVTTVYVPTVLPDGGGDGELKIVRNAPPGLA